MDVRRPALTRIITITAVAVSLTSIAACRGHIDAAKIDASSVASLAMDRYDLNQDGKLDGDELSPGLREMLKTSDEDKDGELSQAEIENRMKVHVTNDIGLISVIATVTLDDQPLDGASIVMEPDPIMEGVIQPARATSDSDGFAEFQTDGQPVPGVRPGIYTVKVETTGKSLPVRYNAETTLGAEVGGDAMRGGWRLELKSQ